ncbi:MAG TPA: hypothetical protein PKI02_13400 [Mycobacterium sp.]|nr:hypothetical protein [Mycobacterium sp.]
MNRTISSISPAQQDRDGRYAHVGAAVAVTTAAGTLVALWFFPIVVCAIWTVMVAALMIGARPMSAVTVS